MQYYKAKVRLAGSTMNEVEKVLSAPELLVLQFVHGVDAITNVSKAKVEKINLNNEKQRLKGLYDQALVKRKQSIDTIFGPLAPIVEELPQEMLSGFGIIDEDDVIAVAKNATQNAKADKSGRQPANITEANRLESIVPPEEINIDEIMA